MQATKGELTKRAIVAKAAPLFNKQGYQGTSLADLMQATGLQKGGIYRHFASKEDLATEAFDYSWRKAVQVRLVGVEDVPNSVDRLKKMIDNFVELRSGLVPGGCPLMNTAVEADDGNRLLRAKAQKALQQWSSRLSRIVADGIRKREIHRRVDARKLSRRIIAGLEGALLISRLHNDREPLHDMRQHLDEYFEQNVRAKPLRRKARATTQKCIN
jgi:TetR/AcrR family transcriptional repressor of nem operon